MRVNGEGSEWLRETYDAHGEKLRFLLVGVWNTIFSVALYNVVLFILEPFALPNADAGGWLGVLSRNYYLVAFWLSWVFAVVQSTVTMKYLAFRSPGRLGKQIARSYLVYLPAQGLSTGILWLAVQVIGLSPRIGQLITVITTTIFSYLGHKYFTFGAGSKDAAPEESEETGDNR